MKAVYKDNWETFLPNSGLKIFFDVHDHFSQGYISKLIAPGSDQRRAVPGGGAISPEDIGTLFASVPDRDHADYPGLGLARDCRPEAG